MEVWDGEEAEEGGGGEDADASADDVDGEGDAEGRETGEGWLRSAEEVTTFRVLLVIFVLAVVLAGCGDCVPHWPCQKGW